MEHVGILTGCLRLLCCIKYNSSPETHSLVLDAPRRDKGKVQKERKSHLVKASLAFEAGLTHFAGRMCRPFEVMVWQFVLEHWHPAAPDASMFDLHMLSDSSRETERRNEEEKDKWC